MTAIGLLSLGESIRRILLVREAPAGDSANLSRPWISTWKRQLTAFGHRLWPWGLALRQAGRKRAALDALRAWLCGVCGAGLAQSC